MGWFSDPEPEDEMTREELDREWLPATQEQPSEPVSWWDTPGYHDRTD